MAICPTAWAWLSSGNFNVVNSRLAPSFPLNGSHSGVVADALSPILIVKRKRRHLDHYRFWGVDSNGGAKTLGLLVRGGLHWFHKRKRVLVRCFDSVSMDDDEAMFGDGFDLAVFNCHLYIQDPFPMTMPQVGS